MHYRSIYDLNATIARHASRLPADIDLVVGIPRSGLLAANLLSLLTNLPLADLDGYLAGRLTSSGKTKSQAKLNVTMESIRRVLILDDSINVGSAMQEARARIAAAGFGHECTYAAVYGQRPEHQGCDFIFEVLPQPRIFQWNLMHHNFLARACIDIDGVLCQDPTEAENDDGERYVEFLLNAPPLHRPTKPLGTLVTSRLEKYRPQTERWLAAQGIVYDKLVMLDLPSAEERRRQGAHGSFKAEYYRRSDAILFLESELPQARKIAQISRKPVLCLETHTLFDQSNAFDEGLQVARNLQAAAYRPPLGRQVKQALKASIGASQYEKLKRFRARLQF
ncbi:phosphoribosyltransferase family protein [Affinirhizobium pseudoryzae]|uniref:phosphoribosyltransferase family protein n=1 Tax=Allorhizobium pseudoryzae TaxID=379684 RepID=UPI0013EE1AB7|nr:phosphoribosyltransferase family protein [Allorhizobium pseudoryzae]